MKYRTLGRTGLQISEIGFGAWGIGNTSWIGADDTNSIRALVAARDAGVKLFDTALVYGRGHSERLLMQAFGKSKDIVVASKVPPKDGRWPAPSGVPLREAFPKWHVLECLRKSLANLHREVIDLYQFHVWSDEWATDPQWLETLDEIRRSGQVRFIGISVNDHQPANCLQALKTGLIDSIQVIYNLFDQSPADQLFPYCLEHNIGVIARVPLDEGGLTGTIQPGTIFPEGDFRNRYFRGGRKRQVWERVQRLASDADIETSQLPDLALRFCLSHQAVTTIIPGMRTPAHVLSNVAASDRGPLHGHLLSKLRSHRWDRNLYDPPATWRTRIGMRMRRVSPRGPPDPHDIEIYARREAIAVSVRSRKTLTMSETMTVYELDPIRDTRWQEFLLKHPQASVFHTAAWLEALRDTYGYESVALSTSGPGEALTNGVVFCRVKSWLTGSRMVSLPFADHCQPLVDDPAHLASLLSYAASRSRTNRWKYVELRPLTSPEPSMLPPGFAKTSSFCFHELDLRPATDELYRRFHKSCVQRKLQRAEREDLKIKHGRSESLLINLYSLLLLTRRRHQLPPQPLVWFSNLIRRFGDDLVIWIASKDTQPIAGILMLRFKNAVVYKYGCSDSRFHNLGGMPALFWHAIRDAKERGAEVFDFGRSETENSGLVTFKDHWGSTRSELQYYRYARESEAEGRQPFGMGLARSVFSSLPDFCLTAAGRLLYRHIG